jgi:hypothetical protein
MEDEESRRKEKHTLANDPKKNLLHEQRERALMLGRIPVSGAERELAALFNSPFPDVRRLAASAAGKIAERANDTTLSTQLLALAANDTHPQVRQYALKALAKCPRRVDFQLGEVKDLARDATLPEYVRRAAAELAAAVEEHEKKREALHNDICRRCHRHITPDESRQSLKRYGRPYCRHCLDEIQLESVNFERNVESAKKRRTCDGTAVQSRGELRIANWLAQKHIAYIYDERFRVAEGDLIRPDFYLPEFDIYIEYWGMDTPEYNASRAKKLHLYQRAAKKLISLGPQDLDQLESILELKLSRYVWL